MRLRIFILLFAVAATLLLHPQMVSAQVEQIVDFHSEIWLMPDASLRVIETITVDAAGNRIRLVTPPASTQVTGGIVSLEPASPLRSAVP